jgi:hypothetical protein
MTSLPSSTQRPEPRREDGRGGSPLRPLLASLVDYAGLFPPAGADPATAVRAYDRYRRSEHGWMLGAFVVPSARVVELSECLDALPEAPHGSWPLSVLVPSVEQGVLPPRVAEQLGGRAHVRALEVAPQEPHAILAGSSGAAEGVRVFYEVRLDDRMHACLDAVARVGATAKLRTGGVTPEAFPEASRLADFVYACAERGLAFKATAGLHHASRGRYALTYEPTSASTDMYGFLDLALVSALLWSRRIDPGAAAALLAGPAGSAVAEQGGVRWHGHGISSAEISRLRERAFISFGSCSFEEPVADLKRMGLL